MSAAWASFHAEWSAVVRAWCRKDPRLRGDPLANGWDILVDVFDACYLQGGGAVTEQALRRATNRLSTERRRQTRHEITSAPIEAFPERRPRAALTADEWKRLEQYLKQLLGTLPPNQRIALEGRYLEQRSDREIATEIGCAVASVRVVRHRALDELRRLVLKSPPPDDWTSRP